jgi:hypothetical protein
MGGRARAAGAALAMTATIISMALLAMPAAGVAAGGEAPVTVVTGFEGPAWFNFGISPKLLPAGDPGATELKLELEESPPIGSGDGIPPGIAEATFGLDRSIRLDRGDLPVCRMPGLNFPQIDASGAELCPRAAVVGHAEAVIEIAFPERESLILSTEGNVYNGGAVRGVPILLVALPTENPVGGRVAFVVQVRPIRSGRIGSELTFKIPTLFGGQGLFRSFKLDLERGFTDHGERTGYVTAECRDGKVKATLAAVFTDGTQYSQEAVRACSG